MRKQLEIKGFRGTWTLRRLFFHVLNREQADNTSSDFDNSGRESDNTLSKKRQQQQSETTTPSPKKRQQQQAKLKGMTTAKCTSEYYCVSLNFPAFVHNPQIRLQKKEKAHTIAESCENILIFLGYGVIIVSVG